MFKHQHQGQRHGEMIGGRPGPFEVDSFHAPLIGIMLNAENYAGDRSLPIPPVLLLMISL